MSYASLRSAFPLALLLTSCAALRGPFVCPEHGGSAWTEVTSAHFVLKTDLGTGDAEAASAKLEETYAALSDLGFASSDKPKNRLDVVYFRSRDAYLEVAPRTTAALFLPFGAHDFERRPIALLGGGFDDATREHLQHELTHLFVHYYYPQVPVWLNEGLARYLETMSMRGGTATLGRAPSNARFFRGPWKRGRDGALLIPLSEAVSLDRLRAMTPESFYAKPDLDPFMPEGQDAAKTQMAHYQAAWCLVHLLMTNEEYAPAFHDYLDRLRAGEPESSAWDRTLDRDDSLDADYKASLIPVETMTLRIGYAAPQSHPERIRVMSDTEIHSLWARLQKWETPEGRREVEADLAEARHTPDDPDLAMVDAMWAGRNGQVARGEEILRRAVAAHPDDPRLWSALGWFAIDDATRARSPASELTEKLAPIAAKLAPIAKSPAQLDLLAHASLLDGKPDDAIGYEKAAVAVDPNCVDCLGWAARAMLEKGLAREALEVATLAQGLSSEGARPPWLASLVQRARASSAVAPSPPK